MRISGKLLFGAAALAASFATVARADDAPASPWGSFSAYVALQSDYRFRGISQNDKQPSEEGSLNWSGPEGLYAGTWLAKVNFFDGTSLETDVYAGKHTDLWGTDLNVEAYYYTYPDHDIRATGWHDSYYETIAQLTHVFGPVTLTATGAWSPDFFAQTGTGWYVEGTASWAVTDWLAVSGDVGHQWVSRIDSAQIPVGTDSEGDTVLGKSGFPYTHWDIGATGTYKNFSLDVRYISTSLNSNECLYTQGKHDLCGGTVAATLTYNISPFPW
ncbi:MAG TPA: TorF family putative porin [Rhizomicrobium sp.]|jgi:uncharacterized protein (TIGR02001 family)|nr:TorF family putative porin [Rhizomicrobium sp.]